MAEPFTIRQTRKPRVPRNEMGMATERVVATVGRNGSVDIKPIAAASGAAAPGPVPEAVKTAPTPAPAAAPIRPICPFSGRPVVYRAIRAGQSTRILIVGEGWISTESFRTEREADYWMARRNGQYPGVHPAAAVKVTDFNGQNDADESVKEAEAMIRG